MKWVDIYTDNYFVIHSDILCKCYIYCVPALCTDCASATLFTYFKLSFADI